MSHRIIGDTAEERELQICRLGWCLLVLWLVTIVYMTKEIWIGETSIGFEEAKYLKRRPFKNNASKYFPIGNWQDHNYCDRLYVGGFSSNLDSQQIKTKIAKAGEPFEISIEIVENGLRKHRGFAFVQCQNQEHANILLAKFSNVFSKVNFAKKEPLPPETIMNNISNVFVRGISKDLTDSDLFDAFGGHSSGVVQCHVADGYGFVLFDTRRNAEAKIREMNGICLKGQQLGVTWARPDTTGRKRKRPPMETDPAAKRIVPMPNAAMISPVLFSNPTPIPFLFNNSLFFPTNQFLIPQNYLNLLL